MGKIRKPSHEMDFGDEETITLHLKERGKTICDDSMRFGIYAGEVAGRFGVICFDAWTWQLKEVEVFTFLEDLKTVWQLD